MLPQDVKINYREGTTTMTVTLPFIVPESSLLDDVINVVFKTTDYDKFSLHPFNRKVEEKRKQAILNQIHKRNLLADNHLVVRHDFAVIMGQGRLLASKELKVPLPYAFSLRMKMEDTPVVAGLERGWRPQERVESWAAQGKEDYLILQKFHDDYPWLDLSNCIRLLSKGKSGSVVFRQSFNDGYFTVGDMKRAEKWIKWIEDYKKYTPLYNSSPFLSVLRVIFKDPEYDHEWMMDRMSKYGSLLERKARAKQYYEVINEIYNKRRPKEKLHYFHGPRRNDPDEG